MTKEDYMKLSKERLAELLVERDRAIGIYTPVFELPCCASGGVCTNPFHDCINCPRRGNDGYVTTTDTNLKKE